MSVAVTHVAIYLPLNSDANVQLLVTACCNCGSNNGTGTFFFSPQSSSVFRSASFHQHAVLFHSSPTLQLTALFNNTLKKIYCCLVTSIHIGNTARVNLQFEINYMSETEVPFEALYVIQVIAGIFLT